MHLVQDIIKPRALKEKQKTIKISGTLKINEIRGQMNIFSNTDTFEFLKGLITCHALFSLFGLWVNFQFLRRSNVDTLTFRRTIFCHL
jgi:flagellar biosynthesis protein FlhB